MKFLIVLKLHNPELAGALNGGAYCAPPYSLAGVGVGMAPSRTHHLSYPLPFVPLFLPTLNHASIPGYWPRGGGGGMGGRGRYM